MSTSVEIYMYLHFQACNSNHQFMTASAYTVHLKKKKEKKMLWNSNSYTSRNYRLKCMYKYDWFKKKLDKTLKRTGGILQIT